MKQYLCTQMFLLFALLPALVLCMVTPQEENSTRKRPLPLNIDESPVPAKRVAFSEGIDVLTQQTSFMEIEESAESKKRKRTSSPIALEILASAAVERVPAPLVPDERAPTSEVDPLQTETLVERVFSEPNGPVSHVASFLNYNDTVNLMSSKRKLRYSSIFYSKKEIRIPLKATEDAVRRMISSNKHIEKVTIDFNLGHLTILKECTNLRHLIVKQETWIRMEDRYVNLSIMAMLSNFGNLKTLKIIKHSGKWLISDIAPLASLTELTEFELYLNGLVYIEAISSMIKLTKLSLYGERITDFSPLSGLTQLKDLTIKSSNKDFKLTDLIPLDGLTRLDLSWSEVEDLDLTPLIGFTQLAELRLMNCRGVKDIMPLSGLKNMRILHLGSTSVWDIAPLAGLTKLISLSLSWTSASDMSPLSGLYQLVWLDLAYITTWGRSFRDVVSPLDHLTQRIGHKLVINWS
jgi:Leucine-rich repeat (LRR) protein